MSHYFRGQVSKITGVSIETLRFYEKTGLIAVPQRTNSGYRLYTDDIFNRLEFIKRAKSARFTLAEIKQLFLIFDNKTIDEQDMSELLEKKIDSIGREICELKGMSVFLQKVKDNISNPNKCPLLQSLLKI